MIGYRNQFDLAVLINYLRKLTVGFLVTVLFISGCSFTENDRERSYEELKQRGFYVYVLPESETDKKPSITIASWTKHCQSSVETIEVSNPIIVSYPEIPISITIGPGGVIDARVPTKKVELDNPWFKGDTARYNEHQVLTFEDKFGIPIQVRTGSLPLTETLRLVNELEYVGPPVETVTNPWDWSKCNFINTGQIELCGLACLSILLPLVPVSLIILLFKVIERKF